MSLRSVVKAVAPPIVLDVVRRWRSPHRTGYWWEGIYPHYRDVPVVGEGYAGDVWIEPRTASTRALVDELRREGGPLEGAGTRYGLLACLAASIGGDRKVTVLDFGGAMGVAYAHLLGCLPDAGRLEYHIVDNARSCTAGARLFRGDRRVHFHTSLAESLPRADLVFTSGVLQYLEDYEGVMRSLARRRAPWVLHTYVAAGDIPRFASAQRNLKGSVLAAWFFNLEELVAIMADAGYRLALYGWAEDTLDMANFPAHHRLQHMANLLFTAT